MFNHDAEYGTCGTNIYGWKYYQNGKHYNNKFEEVDETGKLVIRQSIPASSEILEISNHKVKEKRKGRKPKNQITKED